MCNVPDILRTYAVKELEVGSMGIGPLVRQHDSGTTCHVMVLVGKRGGERMVREEEKGGVRWGRGG